MIHSPFLVFDEFCSPQLCENILDDCGFTVPDIDTNLQVVKTIKTSNVAEEFIFNRLEPYISQIENWYNIQYKGTERMTFEWYTDGAMNSIHSENSEYLNNKWIRVRPADLTCILFLSDHQNTPPLDDNYECYGGKLEFPQHQFGFNPQRGTLIVFPSAPHFLNATAKVVAGNLYQVRFNLVAQTPFLYNPSLYPGNFTTWFK